MIVLDPLCGKATYLVEAATTWDFDANHNNADNNTDVSISFVGIDASDAQLEDARRNVNAVTDDTTPTGGETSRREGRCDTSGTSNSYSPDDGYFLLTKRTSYDKKSSIALCKGDSRDLSSIGFEDGSVTAIATCPPFGRQFFALDDASENDGRGNARCVDSLLAASYREWLHEWARVLHPSLGRIALLVDVGHQEEALAAIEATESLSVVVHREAFRLGRVRATVIVAEAGTTEDRSRLLPPLSRFPWEGTSKEARAEWARLRAASLGRLEPYTKRVGRPS